jgi:hypothetical protein
MAIRFSPYAVLKTLSINTLMRELNANSFVEALDQLLSFLDNPNALFQKFASSRVWENELFKPIGLAENVSIDESYNARPVWGIGEPTNPIVVPNNYSVSISISRLTLDTLSVREFNTLPDYWYAPRVQARVENFLSGVPNGRDVLDYPFYTFLFISSIEEKSKYPSSPLNVLDELINRRFYSFMPSEYSQRITSGDSIIITDVRGTGKLLNLRGLISELSGSVS